MARFTKYILLLYTAVMASSIGAQSVHAQIHDDDLHLLSLPGHHAILRHALAPGTGDPDNFKLGDCSTQRNLDARGRAQAERTGGDFRKAGIIPTQVLSSGWCRCMETGELMTLGPVKDFEPLHSVWTTDSEVTRRRTAELLDMLSALPEDEKLVMVTHWVNISALTGQGPSSGGGYVIKMENGKARIVGEIAPR